jgi:glycosyltransferase involved in cell wall biosynthesis
MSQVQTTDDSTVTVIVPFLNAAKFIDEAIESVFGQSYQRWDLLLVDDGSSDRSVEIARRWAAAKPQRVRCLEHPERQNLGAGASRNLGIHHAQGRYVAFLDADDVWLPHKLDEQVAILDSQPEAALVYGRDQYWYSWTAQPQDRERDFLPPLGVPGNSLIYPPTLLPLFLEGQAAVPGPTSVLVRRSVLDEIGGFVECFRGLYEDQAFYAKLCLRAPMFAVDACWNRYRQHRDSLCAVAERRGELEQARAFFLKWLSRYLDEHQVTDPTVWLALRRQAWLCRRSPSTRFTSRTHMLVRWAKKWVLRLERVLPTPIRRRVWMQGRALG